MTAADEQQLILQIKEGSHEAFRVVVERYMKFAYNIAYGFVRNHYDAEDVAQESFVRVYESINTFRGDAAFNTWLYRIVANLSLNRLRQKKKVNYQTMELIENQIIYSADNPSDKYRHDVQSILERALHELPTLQRAVVILRHLNGLSTKQVSSILHCSEGTVKTHLFRGLKKMQSKVSFLKDEIL
ncbi:MAG: RNA polymerase sigma factor [Bacteroidota bacterium]|nr:RNA polymerase sigma factor [Bacteroidota bacterium]